MIMIMNIHDRAYSAVKVSVQCPKSIAFKVLVVLRLYQNMKSIPKAVFNIPRSQAIFCIGYNVNLQTAFFGFCTLPQTNRVRGRSGIKAISKCEDNQTSGFQDIAFTSNCGRTDGRTARRTDGTGPSHSRIKRRNTNFQIRATNHF